MNSDLSSLQELILNNLLDNFSYYSALYRSAANESLKKSFLFFRRKYTQTFFDKLREDNKLRKDHLDLLLDGNLMKLDISFLLLFQLKKETFLEKVIPNAQHIQELLCLNKCNISDALFVLKRLIPYASNVKRVLIPSICNDKLIKLIASSCPDLMELDIHGSDVTGEGIKTLCTNSNRLIQVSRPITCLNITETLIDIDDVAYLLKNLPALEKVDYDRLPLAVIFSFLLDKEIAAPKEIVKYNFQSIHISDIDILKDTVKYNLQSLNFSCYQNFTDLTRVLSICSKTCPKLKSLSLEFYNLEELNVISSFPDLENLKVSNRWLALKPEKLVIDNFHFGTKLIKYLYLSSVSVSMPALVENCPNLETLVLNNTKFEHLDENPMKLLKQLHTLEIEDLMNDQDLESLKNLLNSSPKLETLSFYCPSFRCIYTRSVMWLLQSLSCNLKHLIFKKCAIDCDFLEHFIINCDSILTLTLVHCRRMQAYEVQRLKQIFESNNRKITINFIPDDIQNDFVRYINSDDELGVYSDVNIADLDSYFDSADSTASM